MIKNPLSSPRSTFNLQNKPYFQSELCRMLYTFIKYATISQSESLRLVSLHEESNLRHSDSALRYSIIEPQNFIYDTCILLGSAMSIASCFVDRIKKMLSFKLGKEIEKDLWGLSNFSSRRKNVFFLPSLKLTIFLILFKTAAVKNFKPSKFTNQQSPQSAIVYNWNSSAGRI